jgi:hypothetical protein
MESSSSSSRQLKSLPSIVVGENIPGAFQHTMKFIGNNIELLREKVVDFANLKTNGQRVSYNYWFPLGILHYFEMLNGRTYPDLVNHFWLRAYVYNEEDAAR